MRRLWLPLLLCLIVPTAGWGVSPSDYSNQKTLTIRSVPGNPTVSKAQPLVLDNEPSRRVSIDFSSVDGPEDVAVFDETGSLLPYEIETLDTTADSAVLWVYNDWNRDGTVQAQVAYGNGPSDNQDTAAVWSNDAMTLDGVYHLNETASVTDSTSSNNDGTIMDDSVFTRSGAYNGGRNFDGSNDYVRLPFKTSSGAYFLSGWMNIDSTNTGNDQVEILGSIGGGNNNGIRIYHDDNQGIKGQMKINGSITDLVYPRSRSDRFYHVVMTYDPGNVTRLYVDGVLRAEKSIGTNSNDSEDNLKIGANPNFPNHFPGIIDEVKAGPDVPSPDYIQAGFDASEKGGYSFFSDPPSVSDYQSNKDIHVRSVAGNPTVSRVQPVYLIDGDPNNAGTGPITIDFTAISDATDLAFFDETGSLLDYEIETLDTTGGTGVVWVYNDWVRDGSVQMQVAYGNGDRNAAAQRPTWNNGQRTVGAYHVHNDPLFGEDSTQKFNGKSVKTGTQSTPNGQFGPGMDNDGSGGIKIPPGLPDPSNSVSVSYWFKTSTTDVNVKPFDLTAEIDQVLGLNRNEVGFASFDDGNIHSKVLQWDAGVWNHIVITHNKSTGTTRFYQNGTQSDTEIPNGDMLSNSNSNNNYLGASGDGDAIRTMNGKFDEFRVYNDVKSAAWVQAGFDASRTGGQTFFGQNPVKQPLSDGDVVLHTIGTETADTTVANTGSDTLGITVEVHNNYSVDLDVNRDTPSFSTSGWTKETTGRPTSIPAGDTKTWTITVSTTADTGDVTVDGAVFVTDPDSPANTLVVSGASVVETIRVQTVSGLVVESVSVDRDTAVMRDGVSGDWSDTIRTTVVVANQGGAKVNVTPDSDDLAWVNQLDNRVDTRVHPRNVSPVSATVNPDSTQTFEFKTVLPDSSTRQLLGPVRVNVADSEPTGMDKNTGGIVSDPDGAASPDTIGVYQPVSRAVTVRSPGNRVRTTIPGDKYPVKTFLTADLRPRSQCLDDANEKAREGFRFEVPDSLTDAQFHITPSREEQTDRNDIDLTLKYDDSDVESESESDIRLVRLDESLCEWKLPVDESAQSVDVVANTVTTPTDGFSFYQPIILVPVPPDLSNFTVTPNPYKPNDGNPSTGRPYDGTPGSGIVFANVPANTSVEIYTFLGGGLVAEGRTDSGGDFHWDVRNEAGQLASSGWYLYKVKDEGNNTVKTGKFAIIR